MTSPRTTEGSRASAVGKVVRFVSRSLVFAVTVLAFTASSHPGSAQPPESERFDGTWSLIGTPQRGEATLWGGFETALRDHPLFRMIARQRVQPAELLARRYRVSVEPQHVTTTLECARSHRYRTRLGHPAQVRAESGEPARLTQLFRAGHLEQVYEMDEGRRWVVFELEGDDAMRVSTTIDPVAFDRNIRYALRYRRQR